MDEMKELNLLTIGQLAASCGVNLQTVRFYERQGLLPKPPRSTGGYRMFEPEMVRRIRFIKRAQELGFTLAQVKELLALRLDPGTTCADVRGRAQAKLSDVDQKIRDLRGIRRTLSRLLAACPGGGSAANCPILESLQLDVRAMPSARTPPRIRRRTE